MLHILKWLSRGLHIVSIMAMVRTSHSRKGLIVYVVLALLSMLTLSPALAENMPGRMHFSQKMQFKASFSGGVVSVTPLSSFDKLQRFDLVTSGSVKDSNMPFILGASVVIKEQILLHLPQGNGLSIGGFIVSIPSVGEIRVKFTATVTSVVYFKGTYEIVGGTGLFERVRGYGTISGGAIPLDPLNPLSAGATVYGAVDGYIWGLPPMPP
jgi:hypothetical protein